MMPALPRAKLCSVIIELMWTPAGAPRTQAEPRIAASRMSKLRQAAMTPINPMDLKLEQVSCALEGD